jgi:YidC/Oxa1 family membrane protein insertase
MTRFRQRIRSNLESDMNISKKWTKTDLFVIGILFALLLGWGPLWAVISKHVPGASAPVAAPVSTNQIASLAGPSVELKAAPAEPAAPGEVAPAAPAVPAAPAAPSAAVPPAVVPAVAPVVQAAPPPPDAALVAARRDASNVVVLSNGLVRLSISRLGGGIVSAELLQYPVTPKDPEPLVLDFAAEPALALVRGPAAPGASDGLKPFAGERIYDIRVSADGRSATLTAPGEAGLKLERVLTLGDDYLLTLEDRFINGGAAQTTLPEYGLQAGALYFKSPASGGAAQGPYLGIDTLSSAGGEDVRTWGSSSFFSRKEQLSDFFLPIERRGGGCDSGKPALVQPLPVGIRHPVMDRTEWLAVKNKFFTQILVPEEGAAGFVLGAERTVPPQENATLPNSWSTAPLISGVSAVLMMDPVMANPGETVVRKVKYYVGPKDYSRMEAMGNKIEMIMEFGMLRSVCWLLLVCLKGLYAVIPNYGVAIILLTILIRLIFWPITHKSTESMRRMQEIQPLIAALREKYKDKPQKIQEETMKLYKEHKVNPIGGCLPMLIQIPVFIALFNVLRSGVELRYAGFLWVTDLSEPEGLLAGVLPIAINILPIIMTATSVWQSYLTPSSGDAMSQKMMLLMPIMMLFIFYSMPSALVLYWTANQVLMIVQLLWQKKHKKPGADPIVAKTNPNPKKKAAG